jgi:hypothetical protein
MTQLSTRLTRAALACALTLAGHAFAADNIDKHAVPALAGRVYEAPPSINSDAASVAHIHLTVQDLDKRNARPASGVQPSTNAWGAAGAGAAPIAASGPPAVYTTMASAAAAGVEPFNKPEAGKSASAAHVAQASGGPSGWKTYALIAAAILAVLGLTYFRKRRNDSA